MTGTRWMRCCPASERTAGSKALHDGDPPLEDDVPTGVLGHCGSELVRERLRVRATLGGVNLNPEHGSSLPVVLPKRPLFGALNSLSSEPDKPPWRWGDSNSRPMIQ